MEWLPKILGIIIIIIRVIIPCTTDTNAELKFDQVLDLI